MRRPADGERQRKPWVFKRKSVEAKAGDLFIKVGNRRSVWVVERVFEHVDGIVHARLHIRERPSEIITVAAATLCDPVFFEKMAQP